MGVVAIEPVVQNLATGPKWLSSGDSSQVKGSKLVAYWLFKEEPDHYSYDDLVRDKRTIWDGVENNLALIHLRNVAKGDLVYYYHTGNERAVVGVMEVVKGPYRDPAGDDDRLVVVDVKPLRRLDRPVSLAEIKADAQFADFALVRNSRLSVMPVTDKQWKEIERLSVGKSLRDLH